eukprot:6209779-Pleurochrysis_carterae.AAC.5
MSYRSRKTEAEIAPQVTPARLQISAACTYFYVSKQLSPRPPDSSLKMHIGRQQGFEEREERARKTRRHDEANDRAAVPQKNRAVG